MNNTIQEALAFAHCISSNPYDLCRALGIEVISNRAINVDGYLICDQGCKLIFVSSNITNRHRQKFVVSHELGHFLLHREKLYCCANISEAGTSQVNSTGQESEANYFASEYLLPQKQLSKLIPHHSLNFSDISKIAAHFDVSVTLSAIKAIQFSNTEDEILLCYKGQQLKWFSSGDSTLRFRMLPKVCPVDLKTSQPDINIAGVWDALYEGSVHQEIFIPFGNQRLVLLSGKRR